MNPAKYSAIRGYSKCQLASAHEISSADRDVRSYNRLPRRNAEEGQEGQGTTALAAWSSAPGHWRGELVHEPHAHRIAAAMTTAMPRINAATTIATAGLRCVVSSSLTDHGVMSSYT